MDRKSIGITLAISLLATSMVGAVWTITHQATKILEVKSTESVTFEDTFAFEVLDTTNESKTSNVYTITLTNIDSNKTLAFELTDVKADVIDDCDDYENDCIAYCEFDGTEITDCNGSITSIAGLTQNIEIWHECEWGSCPQNVTSTATISEV